MMVPLTLIRIVGYCHIVVTNLWLLLVVLWDVNDSNPHSFFVVLMLLPYAR